MPSGHALHLVSTESMAVHGVGRILHRVEGYDGLKEVCSDA